MAMDCMHCELYTCDESGCGENCSRGFGKCCANCGSVFCFKREEQDISAFDIIF